MRPELAPHVRRQFDRISGLPMLLHPEGAVELSETADSIVQLCDGKRTVEDIVAALAAEFDAPPEVLRGDIETLLADLEMRGLLSSHRKSTT